MIKHIRIFAILLILLILPCLCAAENTSSPVINLIDNPEAEYAFAPDSVILEIVFPRVFSSDCIILRFGEETMLVDASTESPDMQERIRTAISLMEIDHFDVAYNSHPHRDHIMGFPIIHEYAPLKKFVVTFPQDFDWRMREIVKFMNDNGIPVENVGNGDHMSMGAAGEVSIEVIQRNVNKLWPVNDRSAMLHITYGERTILLTDDNENRSQHYFTENPPHVPLKADILKYPHHGSAIMMREFKAAVDPYLCFMNGAANALKETRKYLEQQQLPYLVGYDGITRMRTDGKIWVVDYIDEPAE